MRTLRYTQTGMTEKLIVANLAVFVLCAAIPRLEYYLAMIPGFVLHGWVWQLFTYMFVHGGVTHIFFNMLSLYIFGRAVEYKLGSNEFLLFYLAVGLGSGIFSFLVYVLMGWNVILVGASGAIYGVLLLFAVFYPYARIFVFGLLPVRAPVLVVIYTAIELYSEVFGVRGGISHLTHLGGLLVAYLYCLVRLRIDPIQVFRDSR